MSFLGKLTFWKRGQTLSREAMAEASVKVLADDKLEKRLENTKDLLIQIEGDIDAVKKVESDPVGKLGGFKIRLTKIYHLTKLVGIPYGSPGLKENAWYAKMVWAFDMVWHRQIAHNDIIMNMLTGRDRVDQEELVRKWDYFLTINAYPRAGSVLNQSFGKVMPPHATVIQSMQLPGVGGAPPKKEDELGANMWEEYYKQMDYRLKRLEETKR